jgi:predicted dehydrogenase
MQTPQQASDTSGRLRVGVLGNSCWAWWCHGAALQDDPATDFIGFWGLNAGRAAAAAARVRGRPFHDLDDLLDQVDVVSMALPPQVQAPLAVRAAQAGKHLLLDKPLALDVDAADEVVRAVNTTGVSSLSFMTFLVQPEVVETLAELRAAADCHGPWECMTVRLAGSIDAPGSPYGASPWRREHGGLWDWGPHGLPLIRELLSPVSRVSAIQGTRDLVNVLLEHTDGATSLMTLTVTAPPAAQHTTATVWGPGGRNDVTVLDAARRYLARDPLRRMGVPLPTTELPAR